MVGGFEILNTQASPSFSFFMLPAEQGVDLSATFQDNFCLQPTILPSMMTDSASELVNQSQFNCLPF